jgi:hypothetical protein
MWVYSMAYRLLGLLLVHDSSPREEEHAVLHGVDDEADDGQDDEEEDDDESDGVVFLHCDYFVFFFCGYIYISRPWLVVSKKIKIKTSVYIPIRA